MHNKKILAIIPARGGSKRIPRKNIKDFLGKPIISYSIEAAIGSNIFDEIMVSTDDEEIAKVAKKYGAKIPFLRSIKSSDDYATIADVMKEVLSEYKKQGKEYDYAFCLFPTAPFITEEKLKNAFAIIIKTGADVVLPVTSFSFPIQRGVKIKKNGKLAFIWPENANTRSQCLMPAYHEIGQYVCFNVKKFLARKKPFAENTVPIITPESEVQDIDNKEDWKVAEIKYKILRKLGNK